MSWHCLAASSGLPEQVLLARTLLKRQTARALTRATLLRTFPLGAPCTTAQSAQAERGGRPTAAKKLGWLILTAQLNGVLGPAILKNRKISAESPHMSARQRPPMACLTRFGRWTEAFVPTAPRKLGWSWMALRGSTNAGVACPPDKNQRPFATLQFTVDFPSSHRAAGSGLHGIAGLL